MNLFLGVLALLFRFHLSTHVAKTALPSSLLLLLPPDDEARGRPHPTPTQSIPKAEAGSFAPLFPLLSLFSEQMDFDPRRRFQKTLLLLRERRSNCFYLISVRISLTLSSFTLVPTTIEGKNCFRLTRVVISGLNPRLERSNSKASIFLIFSALV